MRPEVFYLCQNYLTMKLLMIYCERFAYKPVSKTLEDFPEINEGAVFEDSLVAFIQTDKRRKPMSKI